MAQHDQVLANASGAVFRGDANDALAALFSLSSGSSAPSTTTAYMLWADTATGLLKQRNAANSAWITLWTMSDPSATETAEGLIELATSAEVLTGSDTERAITPAGAAANYVGQGKHSIYIPAAAMLPTVSNGCAALAQRETTAARPDINWLLFDASADEHAQFQIAMPKSWDEGTLTFQVEWSTLATDGDGVAWGLQAVSVADGDTIDVAYGTPVVVTDDAQSAAEDALVTAESSALTVGGTPAAGKMTFFRIFRDVSDANDDMTEDAGLLGVRIFYTVNARTDA